MKIRRLSAVLLLILGLMILAPVALANPDIVAVAANNSPAVVLNFTNLVTTNGVQQVVFVDSAKFSLYLSVRITTTATIPATVSGTTGNAESNSSGALPAARAVYAEANHGARGSFQSSLT